MIYWGVFSLSSFFSTIQIELGCLEVEWQQFLRAVIAINLAKTLICLNMSFGMYDTETHNESEREK